MEINRHSTVFYKGRPARVLRVSIGTGFALIQFHPAVWWHFWKTPERRLAQLSELERDLPR